MAYDRCESLQGSSSRRRSKGRQSGYEPYKRGLNTKIHLAVDSSGMPVRAIITEGTRADCKEAIHLIEGIDAQNLLADRGYDTSEIVAFALSAGINVVIPPKKNRKVQREYDRYLYKIRHLVENAFLWLELSSQVQQRIEENLKRGLPAEAFARATVEFGNEGCYLSLAEVLHINRLGTVFTD